MKRMSKTETKVPLPARLSFDGKGGFKPGRGQAGWTVYTFDSVEDRDAFMRAYPEAAMPCWRRIEVGQ